MRQALSKRIHYGKFVAEAKFLAQREEYSALIARGDAQGLMRLLTNEEVENQVGKWHLYALELELQGCRVLTA